MRIRFEQNGDFNTIQTGTTQANSSADLRITSIGTSGSTYMTISTSGNVGIGTTSPSQKLDVIGTINTTNYTGTNITIGTLNATSGITSGNSQFSSLRITGGSLNATFNSNTIGNIFTTGGNIGIGTTSPTQKLDVSGTINTTSISSSFNNTIGNIYTSSTFGNVTSGSYSYNDTTVFARNLNVEGYSVIHFQTVGTVGGSYFTENIVNLSGFNRVDKLIYTGNKALVTFNWNTYNSGLGTIFIYINRIRNGVSTTVSGPTEYTLPYYTINASFEIENGDQIQFLTNSRDTAFYQGSGYGVSNPGWTFSFLPEIQGNVGIGTTSPSQKLDVSGVLRITSGGLMATFNSNTIGSLITTGGNIGIGTSSPTTSLTIKKPIDSGAYGVGTRMIDFKSHWPGLDVETVKASIYTGVMDGNTQSGYFSIMTANSGTLGERMRITPSGNVAIGTTTVGWGGQAQCTIGGGGFPALSLTSTNNAVITLDFDSSGKTGGKIYRVVSTHGTAGEGQGRFIIQNKTDTYDDLFVLHGRNVGIGTYSPSTRLDVSGDTSTIRISDGSSSRKPQLEFVRGSTTFGSDIYTDWRLYNESGLFHFYRQDTTNSGIAMTLTDTGNVGIGTSSPAAKLTIKDGEILVTNSSTWQTIGITIQNNNNNNWQLSNGGSANGVMGANNLGFFYNGNIRGYLANGTDVGVIDFTGQHRCKSQSLTDVTGKIGYIVSATGTYHNLSESLIDTPTINESLPVVELSSSVNDKSVYGVISDMEAQDDSRKYTTGTFISVYQKQEGDTRLIINSLGEGAIWVCNSNGNVENGDYITTCQVPGLGSKQADDILHNYTVAKSTCHADFTNIEELKSKYQVRFLQEDGTIITEGEYSQKLQNNENVFIATFIGCTYHCG